MSDEPETTSCDGIPNDPLIWALLGQKIGDNNQILALADSLGWRCVQKNLRYIELEIIPNRLLQVTLAGLKRKESAPMTPPFPDLVISAGRRNEPVARWIRRQTNGRCKLVHLGRPWAHPKFFDLIITTPQYDLGNAENILVNKLPLHRINQGVLKTAAKSWQATFSHLPRPWTGVFIGGDSATCRYNAAAIQKLARDSSQLAQNNKGSLLISSSARTPKGALPFFLSEINVPQFHFDADAPGTQNPYLAFLALADAFVVTAESISMLAEACSTNKPVYVFDVNRPLHQGDPTLVPAGVTLTSKKVSRAWGTYLRNHFGPKRLRRRVEKIHEELLRLGRIQWLGDDTPHLGKSYTTQDLANATKGVRGLWQQNLKSDQIS